MPAVRTAVSDTKRTTIGNPKCSEETFWLRWDWPQSPTVIIGREGDAWDEGIVLDPWRYGGVMFFDEVRDDDRYPWEERSAVLAARPDAEG